MANNVRLFLDANVLLEIILSRSVEVAAREFLTTNRGELAISALTAHRVIHFGQVRTTLPVLRRFLSDYTVMPLTENDFRWAFEHIRDDDFEDALQLSVAIRNGCDRFVTFDNSLHKSYSTLSSIEVVLLTSDSRG